MNNIERRDSQMVYISDEAVFEEQKKTRKILQRFNTADRSDFEELQRICQELMPNADKPFVNPPFYCDYGTHIYAGKNFFMNYNGTILDIAKVVIGENFQAGPNVAIYGAGHPMHPASRNTAYEYGLDVVIGDNVWIGGNAVICPGVTIGSNVVIGAGAVVTRDIPDWSFAAGNPARVIRKITEADREYLRRGVKMDEEALAHMRQIWNEAGDDRKFPTCPDQE